MPPRSATKQQSHLMMKDHLVIPDSGPTRRPFTPSVHNFWRRRSPGYREWDDANQEFPTVHWAYGDFRIPWKGYKFEGYWKPDGCAILVFEYWGA
jgi:hypothetical protein